MTEHLHLSTVKKMNLRIMPFIMLLYLVAYIDHANISVAALQMNADLAMSAEMYVSVSSRPSFIFARVSYHGHFREHGHYRGQKYALHQKTMDLHSAEPAL